MVNKAPTRTKPIACQSAFTLVEALLAMAVVGVMATAIYSGFSSATFSSRMGLEELRATEIALEKFEAIRVFNWDQINSNGFVPPTFEAPYDQNRTNSTGGLVYNGTITIEPMSAADRNYTNDIRLVTVELTWNSKFPRKREYSTYVSRYGLQNRLLY